MTRPFTPPFRVAKASKTSFDAVDPTYRRAMDNLEEASKPARFVGSRHLVQKHARRSRANAAQTREKIGTEKMRQFLAPKLSFSLQRKGAILP